MTPSDEHGIAIPEQGERWVFTNGDLYFMSANGLMKYDGKEFTNMSLPIDTPPTPVLPSQGS